MQIIEEDDFVKVVGYEWEFVQTDLVRAVHAAKYLLAAAEAALENHEALARTLGYGLRGEEWRLGVHPKFKLLPGKEKT